MEPETNTSNQRLQSYNESFKKYNGGIKSLQWKGYNSAAARYKALIQTINFEGKSLLDLGCGFGDIIPFIKSKAENFEYNGYDINSNFIEEARKRYPDGNYHFEVKDIINEVEEFSDFDIIIVSGVFNSNLYDNDEYLKNTIKTLFTKTKEVLAFNITGSINLKSIEKKENSRVVYRDGYDMINFCRELSSRIIFRQDYNPKDFTIIVSKED
ncbi:MAG: class I SAM-dependent methyltransferase [Candidatus Dojkabacteria bacterium]